MVEVRLTNGELTVWWLTRQDEPVAKLKGHWRGPRPDPPVNGIREPLDNSAVQLSLVEYGQAP